MKNPFNQIATFEDYVEIIGVPKEQVNSEEAKNRINKWLVQATEQFDSMISGNGKLGRLYRWFEALQDNDEDNYKKYKLIKAICSWVETFVIKGKFWVDGLPVINSNVDIQINSSSTDSNVEMKRKDIIQDLVSVGLYQTTNFGDSTTFEDNQQSADKLIEDLMVLSVNELQKNYLMINPQKPLQGNLDFANNDLVNGGNIIGSTQQARNNIQYYNIVDSTIDLDKNAILGTLPSDPTLNEEVVKIKEEIEEIQQEQEEQNQAIETNANEITTIKNDLGDLGNQVVDNRNEIARVDNVVATNSTNIVNLDNKVNTNTTNIQNNTNNIQTNANNITLLDGRLVNVNSLLNQTIDGLKTLKPFQYIGEYQQGTSYNINQAVSLNNNLYLSKEDNNTTTPPSDKWLLLNEDFATIDLTQYYTKLEVDSIKNTLQNSIDTNSTNITRIQNNYLDKTSTSINEVAATATYFANNLYVNQQYNPNLTPNFNFLVNGNSSLENAEFTGNVNFALPPTATNPTAANQLATKDYVDRNRGGTDNVKLTGNQNVGGVKTFTNNNAIVLKPGNSSANFIEWFKESNRFGYVGKSSSSNDIFEINASIGNLKLNCPGNKVIDASSRRIENVGTPTNSNDAANKSYVDNAVANVSNGNDINYRQVFLSNTVYQNLTEINVSITNYVSVNDLSRSWMIQFERYGQNGNTYEGTINHNFILPLVGKAIFVDSTTYYSTNGRFEEGSRAGIRILRSNTNTLSFMFQLWNSGNRISRVVLYAPPA